MSFPGVLVNANAGFFARIFSGNPLRIGIKNGCNTP